MTAKATYPVNVIAKLLDLTPRRVQHLANEGVIPRAEKGRYELVPAVQGYIRYLRERTIGKDGVVIPDIASERARLTREQADKMAMENATSRGELISVHLVRKSLERTFSAFGSRVDAIPRKAVPRLKGCTGDAAREKVLREMVREALNELSDFDFGGIVRGAHESVSNGGNGSAAPAGPFDQPVGGPVPDALAGEQRGAGEVEHGAG
jgi:phage terminase Nu1 subunit (DNA packaging protein)